MKLIREHIYEKFKQDSDPIKDMGIGLSLKYIEKWMNEETKYHTSIYNETYYVGICAEFGKKEFVEYLVDRLGYDINIHDSLPLRVAIDDYKGTDKYELIDFLLSKGAIVTDRILRELKFRHNIKLYNKLKDKLQ